MTTAIMNDADRRPVRYNFWNTIIGFENQENADRFVEICAQTGAETPTPFTGVMGGGFWRRLESHEMRGAAYDLAANDGQIWVQ